MDSSPNVKWQDGTLSRERRWQALQARGAMAWLADHAPLIGQVNERGRRSAYSRTGPQRLRLGGDDLWLRCGICGDLGFERSDREANVQRVGELARLFADSGAVAVVALVSPYERMRTQVRERHRHDRLPFFEVFLDTPVTVCAERDPKGLYARALSGELNGFTGIDDPYEQPPNPDLRVTPDAGVPGRVVELDLLQTGLRGARYHAGASAQR